MVCWQCALWHNGLKGIINKPICFADARDEVQKKTFTKWVNKYLAKVISFWRTVDSEHCLYLSGLINAVGVTDIYSKQYMAEKEFFACGL